MGALYFIGVALAVVGGIWLVVLAFMEGIWWGLGSLLVPFVSLIFAVTHWTQAKTPFLIQVAGIVLVIASVAMGFGQPANLGSGG